MDNLRPKWQIEAFIVTPRKLIEERERLEMENITAELRRLQALGKHTEHWPRAYVAVAK